MRSPITFTGAAGIDAARACPYEPQEMVFEAHAPPTEYAFALDPGPKNAYSWETCPQLLADAV